METVTEKDEYLIRYLLGEMSEAERDELEDQLFIDEDLSLKLANAENDLIDGYVRGELDFELKRKFERNFLNSERRREKVNIARVLQTEVFTEEKAVEPKKFTLWQTIQNYFQVPKLALAGGLAAILLFLIFGGLWLSRTPENGQIVQVENENPLPVVEPTAQPISPGNENSQILPTQNTNAQNTNEKLEKDPAVKEKPSPTQPKKTEPAPTLSQKLFVAFTLLPPTRSSEAPVLSVPKESQTVGLKIAHENKKEFVKYRAEIRDSSGNVILSREIPVNAKTLSKPISLSVRSRSLVPGTYELTLSGMGANTELETINFYNFSVVKKQ